MNEEEKQAIETLQGLCTDDCINKDVVQTVVNLIYKQQKEIEKLKGNNKELFEEYNKRVSTIIVYEQGLKEIIDEEDGPDTWTYHAVKKTIRRSWRNRI